MSRSNFFKKKPVKTVIVENKIFITKEEETRWRETVGLGPFPD